MTPHATFLALRFVPREALANLRALIRAFPIIGAQGFLDSVNITTGEVGDCVLSLDKGMILAAIANALADDAMRRAFGEGPVEASVRPIDRPRGVHGRGPSALLSPSVGSSTSFVARFTDTRP